MGRVAVALVACSLAAALLRADEAVRPDGRLVPGELSLEKTGKLHFTPAARGEALAAADLAEIRLGGQVPPFRAAPGKVLHLSGGEHLTGVFLGMEKDHLLLRTAWAERLSVPPGAAASLTHLPGWRPVFHDDLSGKLAGWAVKGTPETASGALMLKKPGEALAHSPASPLDTGRISVNFRAQGRPAGAAWVVEALFSRKGGDRRLRVTVAGPGALSVDAGGLKGTAQPVAPAEGWRRLAIAFGPGSLRFTCDDDVLWFTLAEGPGGPLRQVRLLCEEAAGAAALQGSTSLGDFVLERAESEHRRPPGDAAQDELWLAGGDQVFGRVTRADARAVELTARFGVRRFAWTELRGWFPARGKLPAAPTGRGQAVRLWLRSGLRPELDVVEGVLTALDARQLTLRHPLLGDLTMPRAVVVRLRPLS
jgi:hypothetical protein